MNQLEWLSKLSIPGKTKMVLLVMDGVGGLPGPDGLTELEAAHSPNLRRAGEGRHHGIEHGSSDPASRRAAGPVT